MRFRELNQEGVGLGLTISKNLSLALGGDISVTSKLGEGTTFSVFIPATNLRTNLTKHQVSTPSMRIASSNKQSLNNDSTFVVEMIRAQNFSLLRKMYLRETDKMATNLEGLGDDNAREESEPKRARSERGEANGSEVSQLVKSKLDLPVLLPKRRSTFG